MATIVHIEEEKEEKIKCRAATTSYKLAGPKGGTVERATIFLGDKMYINISRKEMKELRDNLDNLLKDK